MNNIYNNPFLNFDALNEDMIQKELKSYEKLPYIYEKMYGEFYDAEKQIMKKAVIGIVSIGGFPVELSEKGQLMIFGRETDFNEVGDYLYKTLGMSSFMSYLNPKNKSLKEVASSALNLGHKSGGHTIQLSVLICGLSSGVEHEFACQRDIVHLSRLTVAKTIAQNDPCLVLFNEKYYEKYRKVLEATKKILADSSEDAEARNLLFPTAKASAIMVTGTLKNFEKLISLKDSGGKEDEFVSILTDMGEIFKKLFP